MEYKITRKQVQDFIEKHLNEDIHHGIILKMIESFFPDYKPEKSWQFIPEEKQQYFFIYGSVISYYNWENSPIEQNRLNNGVVFKTQQQAEHRVRYLSILNRVKNFQEYHNGGKIDTMQPYERVYLDQLDNKLKWDQGCVNFPDIGTICFKPNLAQKCIDEFGDELKLLFE